MDALQKKQTVALLGFSLVSFGLSYATAIVFARALGAAGYDDYAVAISSAVILSTLAEMGTGKYALRIMPAYTERRDWTGARGYIRFSFRLILAVSIVLGLIGALSEYAEDRQFGDYATGVVLLFLPVMAWVGAGSEFVTANRAAIRSAFVTRMLVPGSTLILALVWMQTRYVLTPSRGALLYGAGWVAGLFAVYVFLRQSTPREVQDAQPEIRRKAWLVAIWPFLYFALLISVLAKIGVIILEWVASPESVVAVYSVAAETGAFIYIVAKSTDKLFLPSVSVALERQDRAALLRGRRMRWGWLGSICGAFLAVVFLFGRSILGLFGPEFVEGYPALCIVATATAVWTMASLSPAFLKYVGREKFVIVGTTVAVLVHVALCFPLGRLYGATGAAVAYAIPVVGLYTTMSVMANRKVRRLDGKRSGHPGDSG